MAGNWQQVIALSDLMKDSNIPRQPSRYEMIMRALCSLGREDEAIDLIFDRRFQGVDTKPQDQLLLALHIMGSGVENKAAVAEQLAPAFAALVGGDHVSYSGFMRACGHRQHPQLAIHLLRYLRKQGEKPSPPVYQALLSSLRRGLAAVDLLEEGVSAMREDVPVWGYDLYTKAIIVSTDRGATELAINLLNEMRIRANFPASQEVYHHMMKCLCAQGLWQQFTDTIKAMKQDKVKPTLETFNIAIAAFGGAGDWQSAHKVLSCMELEEVNPDSSSYLEILSACRRAGEFDTAVHLLHVMKVEKAISLEAFQIVAETLMQRNEWARLMNLIEWTRNVLPPTKVYLTALQACGGHLNPKRALEVLSSMDAIQTKPNSEIYEVLLDTYVTEGCHNKALALVDRMRSEKVALTEAA